MNRKTRRAEAVKAREKPVRAPAGHTPVIFEAADVKAVLDVFDVALARFPDDRAGAMRAAMMTTLHVAAVNMGVA